MMEKKENIIFALVSLVITGVFAFLFVNSIVCYQAFDIEYDDLKYSELTFVRFEKRKIYKAGIKYEVYFKEYAKPFEITQISERRTDRKALENLKEDTIIRVYYKEDSSEDYEYVICEMKTDSSVILSLEDYKEVNQNNQLLGMIFSPIMIILSSYLVWTFIRQLRPAINDGLGEVKIEYQAGENVIRIYKSPGKCSLVINDRVVNQYVGYFGEKFNLIGIFTLNGKNTRVELLYGYVSMRLYCDGKLVAKKFIGLG